LAHFGYSIGVMVAKKSQAMLWGLGCILILAGGVYVLSGTTTKSITINIPFAEADVYINDVKYETNGLFLRTQVAKGKHAVIVNHPDFWTWTKVIDVDKKSIVLNAFLTPRFADGIIIESDNPNYNSLLAQIDSETLPTEQTKLVSPDGNIAIWADRGIIFAEAQKNSIPEWFCENNLSCPKQKQVMALEGTSVTELNFYKDRNDVLLFSRPGAIYAIDIGTRSVQNLQQLYIGGNNIRFSPSDDNEQLYIHDNEDLLQIVF